MGVSLRLSDMTKGGTLIDDVDIEIVGARVGGNEGTQLPDAVYVIFDMQTPDGETHTEHLKAADPRYFAPSRSGYEIESIGDKTALIETSKFALFQGSALALGFPEDQIKDDVRCFVGLKGHVKREVPAQWKDLPKTEGKRDAQALVLKSIIALPGQAAGKGKGVGASKPAAKAPVGRAATKAPAAPAANAANAGSDDLDSLLVETVQGILLENNGSIAKKDLIQAVFRADLGANKRAMVKRVAENDFLEMGGALGGWSFADDVLTAE